MLGSVWVYSRSHAKKNIHRRQHTTERSTVYLMGVLTHQPRLDQPFAAPLIFKYRWRVQTIKTVRVSLALISKFRAISFRKQPTVCTARNRDQYKHCQKRFHTYSVFLESIVFQGKTAYRLSLITLWEIPFVLRSHVGFNSCELMASLMPVSQADWHFQS